MARYQTTVVFEFKSNEQLTGLDPFYWSIQYTSADKNVSFEELSTLFQVIDIKLIADWNGMNNRPDQPG